MKDQDRLIAGKLLKPNGLSGFIGVQAYADEPARFQKLHKVQLLTAEGKFLRELCIDAVKLAPGKTLLHFRGVDQREEAAKLSGALISIPREEALPLDELSWYSADLIGCCVEDEKRGLLGVVTDIVSVPAQDVLEIKKDGEANLYFPFLKNNLIGVDLDEHCIRVRLPEGLYEIYRS